MNLLDFTRNGGYRLKQYTLRLMQEAYFMILKAMVSFMDISETGNYIISGCKIVGPNITDGYLYIDGELCKFTASPGTLSTKIRKVVVTENIAFKNGNNEDVIRKVTAETHSTIGVALSAFIRISPVFDAAYVHTDNNFTTADANKLDSIEPGAQVNVKPSWIAPAGAVNEVLDKPDGLLLTYLKQFTYIHGDLIGDRALVTLSFPDIGTSDYKVIINQLGSGSDYAADGLINYHTREHTSTSFKLALVDRFNSNNQSVKFQIILTPDITN
ncbi:hypothetical protein [Flavobacterium sp. N1994]|uniref:hypothetical protein n=1 Tax=Flavobacterium sp. N1994 TaxID=2986827 RepID=UPI002221F612|nr:hypothetical protein [Flavobacterium sp. N1994]